MKAFISSLKTVKTANKAHNFNRFSISEVTAQVTKMEDFGLKGSQNDQVKDV